MLDSNEDNDNEEFAMINPDLVNFDVISSTHTGCETGIARATANKILPPNDHFFWKCYQLNEEQQHLFQFHDEVCNKMLPWREIW